MVAAMTKIRPKCTGSMPNSVTSGRKIGVSMMISGRALDEGARDQDEEHDQDHHQVGVVGEADHPAGDHLGHALEHDAVAEDRGQREQQHHRADVDQAAFERLAEAWRALSTR